LLRVALTTGALKKAGMDSVLCEQDRCGVTMVIEYSCREMKSVETRLNEVWLQEGGKCGAFRENNLV
jgi:hypothetical protein